MIVFLLVLILDSKICIRLKSCLKAPENHRFFLSFIKNHFCQTKAGNLVLSLVCRINPKTFWQHFNYLEPIAS